MNALHTEIKKIATQMVFAAFKEILKDAWSKNKNDVEKFKDFVDRYLTSLKTRYHDEADLIEIRTALEEITNSKFTIDDHFKLIEKKKEETPSQFEKKTLPSIGVPTKVYNPFKSKDSPLPSRPQPKWPVPHTAGKIPKIIEVERVIPVQQGLLKALLEDGSEIIMTWLKDHWDWHGDKEIDRDTAKAIIDFARKAKTPTGSPVLTKTEWTRFK